MDQRRGTGGRIMNFFLTEMTHLSGSVIARAWQPEHNRNSPEGELQWRNF
jgi:hypothetical protein